MNNLVREALCRIIEEHPSLYDDANRCSAMLADELLGKHTGDIDIIVGAIKEKIPAKMLQLKGKELTQAQLDSFKKELHDKRSTDETAAQWVVESWALALGLISSNQCTTGGQSSSSSAGPNSTAGTPNQQKPSWLVILVVGGILTLLVAGIYAVSQNGTSNRKPGDMTGSSPPITLAPPPPTINEIDNAISKLKAMNPNEILEFPVEGDPNYRVIGFKIGSDKYFGWNVKTVEDFLQESLQYNGKFPESDQITLTVLNQSTQKRLILKPFSKNRCLGHFVRSLNSS